MNHATVLDRLTTQIPPTFSTYFDTFRPYTWQTIGLLAAAYLTACQALRWRYYNNLHKEYEGKVFLGEKNGKSNAKANGAKNASGDGMPEYKYGKSMSPAMAQKILNIAGEYDMPGIMEISLSIALFKTYAIPSISRILQSTKQLSVNDHGSKRYTDTGVLISTWLHCPVVDGRNLTNDEKAKADPRAAISIARVNWMHSKYNIKNDDYIYTLSLFVLEPIKWAEKYGWRELSPLEKEAFYVFWYDIGVKMDIKDIPESLEELREWSENYEQEFMKPAESNREVAEYTFIHFANMSTKHFGVRKFMRSLITCFLEERLRIATKQPVQPAFMHTLANFIAAWFRFKFRYLSLPRFKPKTYTKLDVDKKELEGPCPRMRPNKFSKEPWYKAEPSGLGVLLQHIKVAIGLLEPEYLPGPNFRSAGYRLEECGPLSQENDGHEEVFKMAEEIQGCPIVGPWGPRN